uniref:Uncharacterized protein n=1 Tax=Anguilla anguilla TaxID=7936 RepID=A0A0E9RZZ9_ANGAN
MSPVGVARVNGGSTRLHKFMQLPAFSFFLVELGKGLLRGDKH